MRERSKPLPYFFADYRGHSWAVVDRATGGVVKRAGTWGGAEHLAAQLNRGIGVKEVKPSNAPAERFAGQS